MFRMTKAGRMRSGSRGAVEEEDCVPRERRTERKRSVFKMARRALREPVLGERSAATSSFRRDQPEVVSNRGMMVCLVQSGVVAVRCGQSS